MNLVCHHDTCKGVRGGYKHDTEGGLPTQSTDCGGKHNEEYRRKPKSNQDNTCQFGTMNHPR